MNKGRGNEIVKRVSYISGALALFAVSLTHADSLRTELTAEQLALLQPETGQVNYQAPTLSDRFNDTVPLLSFKLSATTNVMRGQSLDVDASYRSWNLTPTTGLNYSGDNTTFSINTPFHNALDFSDSIRAKVEACPEKMLDKMIIDGALGLNFSW